MSHRHRALLDASFTDVTTEARTAAFTDASMLTGLVHAARTTGAITSEQADAWIPEQTEHAEAVRVFLGVPPFCAAATRG